MNARSEAAVELGRFVESCLHEHSAPHTRHRVRLAIRTGEDRTDLGINRLAQQLDLLGVGSQDFLIGYYRFSDQDIATMLGQEPVAELSYAPGTSLEWIFWSWNAERLGRLDDVHLMPEAIIPQDRRWMILIDGDDSALFLPDGPGRGAL